MAVCILLCIQKKSVKVSREQVKGTLIFCIGQNIGSLLSFASVEFVPISVAGSLMFGSMMILGSLFGRIILKEKIGIWHLISMTICSIGLLILVIGSYMSVENEDTNHLENGTTVVEETWYILNKSDTNSYGNTSLHSIQSQNIKRKIHTSTIPELIIGLTLSCLAGLGEIISMIGLKTNQNNIESVHVLTFWFTLSGTVSSAILMVPLEYARITLPTNITNCFYLLGHIGASTCAILCYITAMEKLRAHVMSLVNTVQIPVLVFLQYVLFSQLQPMESNVFVVCGAIVVTGGLMLNPVVTVIKIKYESLRGQAKMKEEEYSILPEAE